MDPNQTLTEIRALVAEADDPNANVTSVMLDLAERVGTLDEWLSKGGFLPQQWDSQRSSPGRFEVTEASTTPVVEGPVSTVSLKPDGKVEVTFDTSDLAWARTLHLGDRLSAYVIDRAVQTKEGR